MTVFFSATNEHHRLIACVTRISVRVRGGDAQVPTSGLEGMKLGLLGDMGSAFFESHCELNDKTSSPFSSNRTMFETEEVRHCFDTGKHDSIWLKILIESSTCIRW